MNGDRNTIPGLTVQNIGSRARPHDVIKGQISLLCWNGYYMDTAVHKSQKPKVVSNGKIDMWVDGAIDSSRNIILLPEQVKAYWLTIEMQEQVKQNILQTLRQEFPRLLSEEYASWDREEPFFPKLAELKAGFDFKEYIGPQSISIGEDVKDGTAYVAWRFLCRWDIEHGLEVVTHRERVIYIAPDSDPWKIYQDNGTYEEEMKEYEKRISQRKPVKKKSWWQFW